MSWNREVADQLERSQIPVFQVDAHNIVPVWVASEKKEIGARTLRPKITNLFPKYLVDFPELKPQEPARWEMKGHPQIDWDAAYAGLEINRTVKEVDWLKPGPTAALQVLEEFCEQRLKIFAVDRNDPNKKVIRNLKKKKNLFFKTDKKRIYL